MASGAAGHALVSGVEVVVPLKELIDVDAELDKLARERSKIEQDLQRVSGKLGNENFLCRTWWPRSRPSWRS